MAATSGNAYCEADTVHVAAQVEPRICGVQLGILSPNEIEALAAKHIMDNVTHTKNLPKVGGPNDPALGPSDRRVRCATCRGTWYECMGHPGVIRFGLHLYHAGFIAATLKLLQTICWVCCRPKCAAEDLAPHGVHVRAMRPMALFLFMADRCKPKPRCAHCDSPQPKYIRNGMFISRTFTPKQLDVLAAVGGGGAVEAATRRFTPTEAHDIFSNISDDDCRALGLNPAKSHPAWMIMSNMLVLPPNARPTIQAIEGSKRKGPDDLTSQTQDVIKNHRALKRAVLRAKDKACFDRLTAKKKERVAAAAADAPADDQHAQAALSARLSMVEFMAGATEPAGLNEAEALAARFAVDASVLALSVQQAAALWTDFTAPCEKLQNSVAILFDNSGRCAPQARQRTGGEKKAFINRWIGKGGRMRQNLVAKRVDMSARTVIVPDATLDVDELGIPREFATVLTIQEQVNDRTLARLSVAVELGPGVPNGATRVLHATGEMTQLHLVDAARRRGMRLQAGDLVERHIRDGDRVVFNRQPSLHRLSMMSHRIKLIDGLAISVPLAVVGPYNADFDGDEMNLHVLQSTMANAEAAELMAVTRNIMNPQTNEPCLGLVQDARVGAMLLTRRTTLLSRDQMHQCVGAIKYPLRDKPRLPAPAATDPRTGAPCWTGKQLVSLILPRGIYLEKWTRGAERGVVGPDDPTERYVCIRDGELLHGALCKATLGSATGGILQRICTTFGQDAAAHFLSDFQRIVYTWLPTRGLTMGLVDCIVAPETRAAIVDKTSSLDKTVASIAADTDCVVGVLSSLEAGRVEERVLNLLTSNLDYASRLVIAGAEAKGDSGFMDMVTAGSKGTTDNVAQVMACLGQQVVDGQRIVPNATSGRTLTCFPPGAHSAAARGFVSNSYLTGMQPYEYFFHMQGGREGLVSTAVKTAETGYGYRSMEKAQENNITQWDASVRNGQGYVIENLVGNDGMDPTRVERVPVDAVLALNNADVADGFGPAGADAANRVLFLRDALRSALLTLLFAKPAGALLLPLNIADEVSRARFAATLDDRCAAAETTDAALLAAVQELFAALLPYAPTPEALALLELVLRWECRPVALRSAGLHPARFHAGLGAEIYARVLGALCQPGDAVGIVSAQSIGEPSTQFTLNAFHQAGLVQRRMTVGVPRLKELTNASRRILTPSMVVPLREPMEPAAAARLAHSLQFTCLDAVLQSSYVQHDPAGDGVTRPFTNMAKDFDLLAFTAAMHGTEEAAFGKAALSDWVVRFLLNRIALMEHGFTPETVAREIASQLNGTPMSIVYSQPGMASWVVRVRLLYDPSEAACRACHARIREQVLLGGIDGITDARLLSASRVVVDAATGGLVNRTEQIIDTEGSSLMAVATRDWAHWERVTTNDVQEIAATLGIVAARAALFAELYRVISYDGSYVDARHVRALVCTMTHRGEIMAATRHGINRVDFSVLQRASYEEPVDMIFQGAFTAEHDDLNGVCQAIIVGQKVPVGTGTVSVQRDVQAEHDAAPTVFGAARGTLSSREVLQLDKHSRKRLREDISEPDAPRSFSATRQAFAAPQRALTAWRTAKHGAAPPFAALAGIPEGIVVLGGSSGLVGSSTITSNARAVHLEGITICTNDLGYFCDEMLDTDVPEVPAQASRSCSPLWPSSPSVLLHCK